MTKHKGESRGRILQEGRKGPWTSCVGMHFGGMHRGCDEKLEGLARAGESTFPRDPSIRGEGPDRDHTLVFATKVALARDKESFIDEPFERHTAALRSTEQTREQLEGKSTNALEKHGTPTWAGCPRALLGDL